MSDSTATAHVAHLLPGFVAGTLAADERRGVVVHIRECPACHAELAAWHAIHDALREPPPAIPADDAVLREVWQRVDASPGAAPRQPHARPERNEHTHLHQSLPHTPPSSPGMVPLATTTPESVTPPLARLAGELAEEPDSTPARLDPTPGRPWLLPPILQGLDRSGVNSARGRPKGGPWRALGIVATAALVLLVLLASFSMLRTWDAAPEQRLTAVHAPLTAETDDPAAGTDDL